MSRPLPAQLLPGVALAVFAAGVVFAVYSLARLGEDLHKLDRKAADLVTLRKLTIAQSVSQQALVPFEALAGQHPPSLTELAAQTLPGVTPSVRQRESLPAAKGWQARRAEVKFDAPAAALGRFLAAAEAARPPWCLVEYDLVTGVTAPDAVRATLLLEALDK